MKIRTGFVSNSSSSSFICDISGAVESGWDLSLEEAEMYECVNGHTMKEEYVKKSEEFEKWVEEDEDDARYELPARFCPICGMTNIPDADLVKYLMKINNITREYFNDFLKDKFGTYKEFEKFIK